jgi:predicted transcriptional regulator
MKTLMNQTLNIRTNTKIKNSLDKYSKKLNISKSKIINDAVSNYLEFRLPQIMDLVLAIRYSEENVPVSNEEANIFFDKLMKN